MNKTKTKIKETLFSFRRRRLLRSKGLTQAVSAYSQELVKSGIIEEVYEKQQAFQERTSDSKVRGMSVSFGGLGEEESKLLYSLIRHYRPERVVETGVCNGVSSYIILEALRKNDFGMLYSIDLPEVEGNKEDASFWEGKGGAAIPMDSSAGWIVPANLRDRWDLRLGNSFELLPKTLDELGGIDLFIHDSEHSYECMKFEFNTVWPYLREKGILLSDDIGWNNAFKDFTKEVAAKSGFMSVHLGAIFK